MTRFGQLWVVGVCHLHARGNTSLINNVEVNFN
jgi:hypothetical protein